MSKNQPDCLSDILSIKYPMIMAPMFLVTNIKMMVAADRAGISGCIPALNFRTIEDFKVGLKSLDQNCQHAYGINLIVNPSNPFYQDQLKALLESRCAYVITSLGSPKEVIERCVAVGKKVFCDVVNFEHGKKVRDLGCDALVAVNSGAGGHAGHIPASVLIPQLQSLNIPVIAAGGVGTGAGLLSMKTLGAVGVSVGSIFIACEEAEISSEYKQACIDFGASDIVMTTKISGTPCTVIQTPYVKKIGTDQNIMEKVLNKNKSLKKYVKMLTFMKGMKAIEKAAFTATYKTVWCAGPSIEFVKEIKSVEKIVYQLMEDYHETLNQVQCFKPF
jgi:nitronate monooxygenase